MSAYIKKRGPQTPEARARLSARLKQHWAKPGTRERQRDLTIARMARPGVSEKISSATKQALARSEIKKRHIAGLKQRYVDNPGLRQLVGERTKAGMARWRAETLAAAEIALRQMPKDQCQTVLQKLLAAAGGQQS